MILAVHEILHALGFSHTYKGIMKPRFYPQEFEDGNWITWIERDQLENWWNAAEIPHKLRKKSKGLDTIERYFKKNAYYKWDYE